MFVGLAMYLGFADITLPHDKWIHFTMFFILSLLFFWITDSKYTWIGRTSTFLVCTVVGGVGSEYAQHYLSPFRTFDYYDIVMNVCGSFMAIICSELYRVLYRGKRDTAESNETLLLDTMV